MKKLDELIPQAVNDSKKLAKTAAKYNLEHGVNVVGLDNMLSDKERRLVEANLDIERHQEHNQDIGYYHSCLCQVGFPRKKVEGEVFQRKWGDTLLMVRRGYLKKGGEMVPQQIPYGALPRLMTAHINRIIKQEKTRVIPLGFTMKSFMREIGIENQTGGEKGRIRYFKKALEATVACDLILGWDDAEGKDNTSWIRTADTYRPWYTKDESQGALFQGEIVVSEPYYELFTKNSVPIDFRALKALKGSSLALDVYVWAAYRMNSITDPKGVGMSWRNLHGQFGQEYIGKNGVADFRKEFIKALKDVSEVYPGLNWKTPKGRLVLLPSPTPVLKLKG